jgi:hypothetical protein
MPQGTQEEAELLAGVHEPLWPATGDSDLPLEGGPVLLAHRILVVHRPKGLGCLRSQCRPAAMLRPPAGLIG